MERILKLLNKNKLLLIGAVVGAVLGYLYFFYVGCSSGSCPITSKPLNSSLYGSIMGGLFFSMFDKKSSN